MPQMRGSAGSGCQMAGKLSAAFSIFMVCGGTLGFRFCQVGRALVNSPDFQLQLLIVKSNPK